MIKKENNNIESVYKGTTTIGQMYKGTQLLYESAITLEQTGVPPIITTHKATGKDLIDYKIYGNSIQGKLPDTYQQVEYIESTGTQYIDTGINPISSTRIDINFAYVSTTSGWLPLFGVRSIIDNVREYYAVFIYNNTLKLTTNYSSIDVGNNSTVYIEANKKYNLKNNQGLFYINDILESSISVSNTLSNNTRYPVYLFDLNQNGSRSNRGTKMKLYSCKFYDGDTLIRNYIPCYRKSDNEIGLYDIVNNVFYTNQGTGVFLKGSNAPTPSAPVEIESVGDRTANILDKNLSQIGFAGQYIKSNGYTPDGKLWSQISVYTGQSSSFYVTKPISIKSNTTYSYSGFQTANNPAYIFLEEDQATIINGNVIRGSGTFVTPSNAKYIVMSIKSSYVDTMMLKEGQITGYEPYGYKIPVKVKDTNNIVQSTINIYLDEPLRKVGDYSDYIDFGNSKVIRNNKEYSVTGQENISIAYNEYIKSDATDCYIPLIDIYDGDLGTVPSICNQLKYSNVAIWGTVGHVNEMTINHFQFHMNIENSLLGITNYKSETISTAKEKITNYLQNKYSNGNPIKVLYPLQIPIEETISLPNIPTIKGTTIFEIDTEIQPSSMYIKYKSK